MIPTLLGRAGKTRRGVGPRAGLLASAIALGGAGLVAVPQPLFAVSPGTVTVAGSMQSEAGCPGDWDPACAATHLVKAAGGVWAGSFSLPAGTYAYKVAIDDSWNQNYGAHGILMGANVDLVLAAPAVVSFFYSERTHWVTSSANTAIVTAAGSFQSELGCPGDWQPDCMIAWLQDVNGDGVFGLTAVLPPGSYSTKATLDRGWTVNYGRGGVLGGPNIDFVVPPDALSTTFTFVAATHVLTVSSSTPPKAPKASAGPDLRVGVGAPAVLDGRGSTDPHGLPLTFRWSEVSGPVVRVTGATRSTARFTPPVPGAYRFRLVVSNGALRSAPDVVAVTVLAAATSTPAPTVVKGVTAVIVSCPVQVPRACRVSLALRTVVFRKGHRISLVVATARATVARGHRARLALPWTTSGRALLRARRTLPMTLLTATSVTGSRTVSLLVRYTAKAP